MTRKRDLQKYLDTLSDEQIEALPEETVAEYESILNAPDTAIGSAIDSALDIKDEAIEAIKEAPQTAVDTARGIGQGFLGLGIGDEVEGAVNTAIEYMNVDNMGNKSFVDNLSENIQEARISTEESAERSPTAFNVGKYSTLVGSSIALPLGTAAKGVSIGVNAARAAVAGGITGAVSSIGQSEQTFTKDFDAKGEMEKALIDATTGMAIGGGLSLGLQGIGKAVSEMAPKLKRYSHRVLAEITGVNSPNNIDDLARHLHYTGQKELPVMMKNIDSLKTTSGERIIESGDDLTRIAAKSQQILDTLDDTKTKLLSQVKAKVDYDDINTFYQKTLNELKYNPTDAWTPAEKEMYAKAAKEFKEVLFEDQPRQITKLVQNSKGEVVPIVIDDPIPVLNKNVKDIKSLYELKSRWARGIKWDSDGRPVKILKELNASLNKKIDDIIESEVTNKALAPDFHKNFLTVKRDMSNVIQIRDSVFKLATKDANGQIIGIQKYLQEAGRDATLAAAGGIPYMKAKAFASGLRMLYAKGSFASSMGRTIGKLADTIENGGDKGRLVMDRLLSISNRGTSEFRQGLIAEYHRTELEERPLKRDMASIYNNKSALISLAAEESPELASQFKRAFAQGDDAFLAKTMNQLSKLPNAKGFIEDGIGWDGKLYDEDDKATARSFNNTADISLHQRLQNEDQIRKGIAPVLKKEPDFQVFLQQHLERTKKPKPGY